MCVAEVVKAEAGDRRRRDETSEELRQPIWMHRAAARRADHTVTIRDLSSDFRGQRVTPAVQHEHGDSAEVDPSARVPRLAARLVELVADRDQGAVDGQVSVGEVDVTPAQTEELAAAHAGVRSEPERRKQPITSRDLEERV
jgi:hypothetical protein